MHCCADIVYVTAMLELPWQLVCHASPALSSGAAAQRPSPGAAPHTGSLCSAPAPLHADGQPVTTVRKRTNML